MSTGRCFVCNSDITTGGCRCTTQLFAPALAPPMPDDTRLAQRVLAVERRVEDIVLQVGESLKLLTKMTDILSALRADTAAEIAAQAAPQRAPESEYSTLESRAAAASAAFRAKVAEGHTDQCDYVQYSSSVRACTCKEVPDAG